MLPDKKRQIIGSIIGMLILLVIAITANLGNGTWSEKEIDSFMEERDRYASR